MSEATEDAEIRFISPLDGATFGEPQVRLRAVVRSYRPLLAVQLLQNDKPLPRSREVRTKRVVVEQGTEAEIDCELRLDEGSNALVITAQLEGGARLAAVATVRYVRTAPQHHALVVGVGAYESQGIRLLRARRDAQAVAKALQGPSGGYVDVVCLTDEQATFAQLRRELGRLRRQVRTHDTVFIYFSGHGEVVPPVTPHERDGACLLPWDADPDDLYSTGLPLWHLARLLQDLPARRVVLVLDCCYSGAISPAALDALAGDSRIVLAACQGDEVAIEDSAVDGSIFGHYLAEVIEAPRPPNLALDVHTLHQAVAARVREHARKLGRSQRPVCVGRYTEPVVVARTRPGAPRSRRLLGSVRDGRGRTRPIEPGTRITIGRAPTSTLPIEYRDVSWFHCEILTLGPRIEVIECGSRNGTRVDDEAVIGHRQLFHGDVLTVGSEQITLQLQQSDSSAGDGDPRAWKVGKTRLFVYEGSILDIGAEALATTANSDLEMTFGVAQAVRQRAGPIAVEPGTRLEVGTVFRTGAGMLDAAHILHCVTHDFAARRFPTRDTVRQLVRTLLEEARRLKVRSLALPPIGLGDHKAQVVGPILAEELVSALRAGGTSLEVVVLAVLHNASKFAHCFEDRISTASMMRVGPYQIEGESYPMHTALDTVSGAPCHIRVLREFRRSSERAECKREVEELAARTRDRPFLTGIREVLEQDEMLFVVWHHEPHSKPLQHILYSCRGDSLPLRKALRYLDELFDAVGCLHAAGVVHGGLRQETAVLVNAQDQVRVTDFGMEPLLAKYVGGRRAARSGHGADRDDGCLALEQTSEGVQAPSTDLARTATVKADGGQAQVSTSALTAVRADPGTSGVTEEGSVARARAEQRARRQDWEAVGRLGYHLVNGKQFVGMEDTAGGEPPGVSREETTAEVTAVVELLTTLAGRQGLAGILEKLKAAITRARQAFE